MPAAPRLQLAPAPHVHARVQSAVEKAINTFIINACSTAYTFSCRLSSAGDHTAVLRARCRQLYVRAVLLYYSTV